MGNLQDWGFHRTYGGERAGSPSIVHTRRPLAVHPAHLATLVTMTSRPPRRGALLLRLLGVLGVVAGVFAMHGLTAHHDAAMATPTHAGMQHSVVPEAMDHGHQVALPIALVDACVRTGVTRFVQISALGSDAAPTPYMQTKREADAYLMASPLQWTILRPSVIYHLGGAADVGILTWNVLPRLAGVLGMVAPV